MVRKNQPSAITEDPGTKAGTGTTYPVLFAGDPTPSSASFVPDRPSRPPPAPPSQSPAETASSSHTVAPTPNSSVPAPTIPQTPIPPAPRPIDPPIPNRPAATAVAATTMPVASDPPRAAQTRPIHSQSYSEPQPQLSTSEGPYVPAGASLPSGVPAVSNLPSGVPAVSNPPSGVPAVSNPPSDVPAGSNPPAGVPASPSTPLVVPAGINFTSHIPSASPAVSPSAPNILPGDGTYEVILEALGTISEQPPGVIRESGPLHIIQGQIDPASGQGYHAFVSIGNINIPLLPSSATRRVAPATYLINIPSGAFILALDPRTEPQLVSGIESIFGWFTVWEQTARPNGVMDASSPHYPFVSSTPSMDFATATAVQTPIASVEAVPDGSSSGHSRLRAKIEAGGNKGVELVNRVGDAVNAFIAAAGEKMVANHGDRPARNVSVGNPTTAALTSIQSVVGAGASVATRVIEKVSSVVESKVVQSGTVERMRNAAPESSERRLYELLTSGCIAVGRVALAADHQGRLIVETAGNNATRVAGVKYGEQAARATQQGTLIAVNTYRIVRFPARLGSTSLLRGGMAGAERVLSGAEPSI